MKTTDRQVRCRDLFETAGYPRSAASALVGNFCVESGEDLSTAFRKAGLDHGSQGLPQWRLDRLTNYQNFVKARSPALATAPDRLWITYGQMDTQVAFVCYELTRDYPLLKAKLMAGGDVAVLTADVCWQYERPNKAMAAIDKRIDYARALAVAKPAVAGQILLKPTVVDHLQAQLTSHGAQRRGGAATAVVGGFGGAALVLSNVAETVPTWEWIAFAVAAVAVIAGLVGADIHAKAIRNVRSALSGVTPDAPPAAEVVATPVEAPVAAADPAPAVSFDEAVRAEVARQLAALQPPAQPMPLGVTGMARVIETGAAPLPPATGATMSINRAQPLEGAK